MLLSLETLFGYHLDAKDDRIGRCKDFMFDDRDWVVRYMVANTHRWLPGGRDVLISPISMGHPYEQEKAIAVKLDVDQIKNSPLLEDNQPISREYESRLFRHYGYGFYWMGAGLWGTYPHPGALVDSRALDMEEGLADEKQYHLRSVQEIDGYIVQAQDDGCGHVADLLVDDRSWAIRYVVVNLRNWLPGGPNVVLPREVIREISWPQQHVEVNLSADQVKDAVQYEPGQLADPNYENKLQTAFR